MFDWIKKLIEPVTDVVDEFVVDKDKKKELRLKLQETMMDFALKNEQEISKRHQYDMQSDSWLSKNIRPIVLAFLTTMFVIISYTDGNVGQFQLNEAFIPVYQNLLITVFGFYFGSRGIEKGLKIYKENK